MKLVIQENTLRRAVRKVLLEYNVSDEGIISGGEGDPYAYKVSKADGNSITFLVVSKNNKKMSASFAVDEKNKNKPGVVRLLKAVSDNKSKFEKVPNVSLSIDKLLKGSESQPESEKPEEDTSGSDPSGYKIPGNLSFEKSWDQLDVRTWVSSTEDIVQAIKYEGTPYFSYGFVSVPDQRGPQEGLCAIVPYQIYREMFKKIGSGKVVLIAQDKTITRLKPKSSKIRLKVKKGSVPILIKAGASGIKLGTYQFDSGAPLTAEVATQILDILGAVPVVGSVADGANVITQLSMRPALYFGAVLSAIGAIPAIGEVAAFIKITKNAGRVTDALRAGRTLQSGLMSAVEAAGANNMRSVLKSKSLISHVFDAKDSIFKMLDSYAPKLDKHIIGFSDKILPKFKEFFELTLKAYKSLKSTPWAVLAREKSKWLELIKRGNLKLTGAFEETVLDKALTDSGVYKAFGVTDPTLSHARKLQTVLEGLPDSYMNLNFDQEFALDKLATISKAFAPKEL